MQHYIGKIYISAFVFLFTYSKRLPTTVLGTMHDIHGRDDGLVEVLRDERRQHRRRESRRRHRDDRQQRRNVVQVSRRYFRFVYFRRYRTLICIAHDSIGVVYRTNTINNWFVDLRLFATLSEIVIAYYFVFITGRRWLSANRVIWAVWSRSRPPVRSTTAGKTHDAIRVCVVV